MLSIFQKHPDILVAMSEKNDGNMKIAPEIGNRIETNRNNFFSKTGIDPEDVVSADLVHGVRVYSTGRKDRGKIIWKTDALVTNAKGVFLSVTVADCLPIFLYDPQKRAVGMIHAGWRGLEKGIIGKTIEKMKEKYKSRPESILAVIGPGICANHYEVGDEVAAYFQKYAKFAIINKSKKKFLDLKKIALIQLKEGGIREKNIKINSDCTYENTQKYFSYRRNKPEKIEAMAGVIGIT